MTWQRVFDNPTNVLRADVAKRIANVINSGRFGKDLRAHARDDHSWHTVFVENVYEGRGVLVGTITVYDNGRVSPRMSYSKQVGEWVEREFNT